jgi:hypothetical protein
LTFTCIFIMFLFKVHKHQSEIWSMDMAKKWYSDWRALAGALCISCIGILVRFQGICNYFCLATC